MGHLLATARRNKEKDVMRRRAEILRQREEPLDLVEVHPRDRRVHLELHPCPLQGLDSRQRPFEGAGNLPEGVVTGRIDAVEADAHSPDACIADLCCRCVVDKRPVGGHDHSQALRVAVGCDLEDVRAQKRLASREDDDGLAESGNLVQKLQAPPRVQLPLVEAVDGGSPAVDAGKVAASRHLPGHHAQRAGQDHPVTSAVLRFFLVLMQSHTICPAEGIR